MTVAGWSELALSWRRRSVSASVAQDIAMIIRPVENPTPIIANSVRKMEVTRSPSAASSTKRVTGLASITTLAPSARYTTQPDPAKPSMIAQNVVMRSVGSLIISASPVSNCCSSLGVPKESWRVKGGGSRICESQKALDVVLLAGEVPKGSVAPVASPAKRDMQFEAPAK